MSAPDARNSLQGCLCLVTDRSFVPPERFLDTVAQAIEGGASMVQLRDKGGRSDRVVYEEGLTLRALCRVRGIPFVVNDRLDLAMALEADGAHLGQGDLPASLARRIWKKDALIGVSASSVEQALRGQGEGADYIGAGAVFATTTKGDARYTGLDGLADIVAALSLPVIAIGGIGPENAERVSATGCAGLAVVQAIWKAEDPRAAAAGLARAIRAARATKE
jgi:thiamine-phosphate pyrophosphorylase